MEGRRPPRASSMMIARNYARPTPIVSLPLPFRKQEISGDTPDRLNEYSMYPEYVSILD